MPKITLVVGLPGSGKSTVSRKLAEADGIKDRQPDDDDFLRANLVPPFGLQGVIARLKAGQTCVVNDISLCKADERQRIGDILTTEVPEVSIHWYYFDNDALQCTADVILDRMHGRRSDAMDRVEAIRYYSWVYQPPLKETHREVGVPPLQASRFARVWTDSSSPDVRPPQARPSLLRLGS